MPTDTNTDTLPSTPPKETFYTKVDKHIAYGEYSQAKKMLEDVIHGNNKRKSLSYDDSVRVQVRLVDVHRRKGEVSEAQAMWETVGKSRAVNSLSDVEYKIVEGSLLECDGKYSEALKIYNTVCCSLRDATPSWDDTQEVFLQVSCLYGSALRKTGQAEEALGVLEDTLESAFQHVPDSHPIVLMCVTEIAQCLFDMGKIDDALYTAQLAAATWQNHDDFPLEYFVTRRVLVECLYGAGQTDEVSLKQSRDEAEKLLVDGAPRFQPDELHWWRILATCGMVLKNAGRSETEKEEGEGLCRCAYLMAKMSLGEMHPEVVECRSRTNW